MKKRTKENNSLRVDRRVRKIFEPKLSIFQEIFCPKKSNVTIFGRLLLNWERFSENLVKTGQIVIIRAFDMAS